MIDYSGALLKIDRAEKHIRDLDFLIFCFLRRQPYRIRQIADLQGGRFGYEISLKEMPPIEISGVLGDAIHNLRASLDLAISAIALSLGNDIDKTYFPFAKFADDIEKMIRNRAGNAGDEAMQICREQRPYSTGNEALWGLHQADIADKHQTLIVAPAIGDFRFQLLPSSGNNAVQIDSEIRYLSVEPSFVPSPNGREFEHPSEIDLSVNIVFPEGRPLAGYPVVATLNELLRIVREIVERFRSRCP